MSIVKSAYRPKQEFEDSLALKYYVICLEAKSKPVDSRALALSDREKRAQERREMRAKEKEEGESTATKELKTQLLNLEKNRLRFQSGDKEGKNKGRRDDKGSNRTYNQAGQNTTKGSPGKSDGKGGKLQNYAQHNWNQAGQQTKGVTPGKGDGKGGKGQNYAQHNWNQQQNWWKSPENDSEWGQSAGKETKRVDNKWRSHQKDEWQGGSEEGVETKSFEKRLSYNTQSDGNRQNVGAMTSYYGGDGESKEYEGRSNKKNNKGGNKNAGERYGNVSKEHGGMAGSWGKTHGGGHEETDPEGKAPASDGSGFQNMATERWLQGEGNFPRSSPKTEQWLKAESAGKQRAGENGPGKGIPALSYGTESATATNPYHSHLVQNPFFANSTTQMHPAPFHMPHSASGANTTDAQHVPWYPQPIFGAGGKNSGGKKTQSNFYNFRPQIVPSFTPSSPNPVWPQSREMNGMHSAQE